MNRLRCMIAGLVTALLAQAASAVPLCRDNKGLFTPCPQSANRTARAILASAPAMDAESVAVKRQPSAPARPSFAANTIRRVRLCTDAKGLFTPCPR